MTPRTYSTAAPVAEKITLVDLAALLAANDNPDVLEHRKPRRIAMNARLTTDSLPCVTYDYCDRAGFTQFGCTRANRSYLPAVFVFGDRVVQVA